MADRATLMPLAPRLGVELARVSSIADLDDLEWSQVELSGDLAGLAVEHLEIFANLQPARPPG